MVKDLNFIHSHLDRLQVNGLSIPKNIQEIPELSERFEDFGDLIRNVKSGTWEILLPNHHLHTNYDIVTSKSIQRVDTYISLLALGIFPIIIAIFGAFTGNYILLLAVVVPYLTNFIGSIFSLFFNSVLFRLFILTLSILGFFYFNLSVGILFGISFLTLNISQFIRNHRRRNTMYNCMNDEYIFCYLFFCNTISLYKSYENEFVRHLF